MYDPTAKIPAVLEDQGPGGTVFYIRDPDGTPIAMVKDGKLYYYHFDAVGSTRIITDSGGNVTDKYAYDPYGSVIFHNRYDNTVDQPYQYEGEYAYYTQYDEPDFGLLQVGVRFYDPQTGRFTQRDRIPQEQESAYELRRGQSNNELRSQRAYLLP